MGVSDFVQIGRSGLDANRQAMTTTNQNITNVNTPGYSRQRPNLSAMDPIMGTGGLRIGGGGVVIDKVVRIHDQFIQRRINEHERSLGEHKMRSMALKEIEDIVHGGTENVSERVQKFFSDLRELSLNPEMATHRMAVQNSARNLTMSFQDVTRRLEEMRDSVDMRAEKIVGDVNILVANLGRLNSLVAGYSAKGDVPGELLDKQDLLVRELSAKIDFQIDRDQLDQVNLIIPGAGVIVQGNEFGELVVGRKTGGTAIDPPELSVHLRDSASNKLIRISDEPAGELGGLMFARKNFITPTLNQLDSVAYTLVNAVNDVHNKGDARTARDFNDFFKPLEQKEGASAFIQLDDIVDKDVDAIAVGIDAALSGDNRIALELAEIQNTKLFPALTAKGMGDEDNNYSLTETMNSIISNVGLGAQTATASKEHHEAIIQQLDNQRESVSGVSLEEEAINLVQYQTAFNAAAKTIKIGDELLQTVLNLVD